MRLLVPRMNSADRSKESAGSAWLTSYMANFFRSRTVVHSWWMQSQIEHMLPKDFPNARLHFSHFVKVHDYRAIDINSLLLLKGRGAAVLCAKNQTAIDSINIF